MNAPLIAHVRPGRPIAVILISVLLIIGCATTRTAVEPSLDGPWYKSTEPAARYKGVVQLSTYVVMRDGVRIALDYYLPQNLAPGEKLPTILDQTRYWRNIDLRWPLSGLLTLYQEIEPIIESGYAFVRVDTRGSGASFGTCPCPWSADEIRDGAQIVDWIVAQPWSDGIVGAAGGSYEGTAAEFLATNRHPALKAIMPMYSLFDTYPDIAFPGGIHLSWFTEIWQQGNHALDNNRPQEVLWWAPLVTRGVAPVMFDRRRDLLRRAVADHAANYRVHNEAKTIVFRDDVSPGGLHLDSFSPHTFVDDLRAADIPIYSYSGWFDGGYPHAAIKRFLTLRTRGAKLILGPWDHGGDDHMRPFAKPIKARFAHLAEAKRFFDRYLKGVDTGVDREPPVAYYTMVADRWRQAQTWPPAEARYETFYAVKNRELARAAPTDATGADEYRVDLTAGTGDRARWNSLALDVAVYYPDRVRADRKLLVYDSPPLAEDTEVTGHPLVTLYVASTATDGQFFAYLEDVDERGRVNYVTEGMLRALHRRLSAETPPYLSPAPYRTFLKKDAQPLTPGETAELTFDLLPVSYLFKKGHRLRLALAGADADHFQALPGEAPVWRVQRNQRYATRLELPIVKR
ncbi:MAG TPA: CocE/NonD family hydrolase [bacterium]|nr:CocE/NonD family hydrolase [bacterium]